MPFIVYAVTSPMTADFLLRGQLRYMVEAGWLVVLVCSPGSQLFEVAEREGIEIAEVPMRRQPAPLRDLVAVVRLYFLFRKLRPDLISYGTPKAALLCGIASWFARVPARIYLLRGLRCEGAAGLAGRVYLATERITSWCSTSILCVSPSLQRKAVELGAICKSKSLVLGYGSSNGVDCERFCPSSQLSEKSRKLRSELGIPETDIVIGFVGRVVRDKGIAELVSAFDLLSTQYPHARLLIVGPQESNNQIDQETVNQLETNPQIHWLPETRDTPTVYSALDIFVLPTHREGFPNVALEAAAMEKPVVASRATGAIDAIDPDVTGSAFDVGDVAGLAEAISRYLDDAQLREKHGKAGRKWVTENFSAALMWERLETFYRTKMAIDHRPSTHNDTVGTS